MYKRHFRLIVLTALLFLCNLPLSLAQNAKKDTDPHATGLLYSKEEGVKIHKEWKHIQSIRLNHLGLQRVNAERKKKGLPLIDAKSAVADGQDIESAVEATPSAGASSSGSTGSSTGSVSAPTAIPAAVDNSTDPLTAPFFPPIDTQGGLGSCASFSVTYYQLTYQIAKDRNIPINTADYSNRFSPSFVYSQVNGGVDGGSFWTEIYTLLSKHGAPSWAQVPYTNDYLSWPLNSDIWINALSARTNMPQYITSLSTSTGLQNVKQALANGYILTFGTFISSWQFTNIKNNPNTTDDDPFVGQAVAYWMNGQSGGHSMNIVGYNDNLWIDINGNGAVDAGELGALKIANSWGSGWGNGGFVWLAYDALRTVSAVAGGPGPGRVGVAVTYWDQANLLTTKNSGAYTPKVVGVFTLNHAKRNQLNMTLGISDTTANTPATIWYPYAIYSTGGPYAFNGSTTAVDGSFAYDFTDILPATTVNKRYYLGMQDTSAGSPGTLKSFQLRDLTSGTQVTSANVPLQADGSLAYAKVDYTYSPAPVTSYTLTLSAPNGTISANPNQSNYSSGTAVTLTATGNVGYQFSSWSGDLSGTTNPVTITMNTNKTVTANFVPVPVYTLAVSAANGTITVSPNQTSFSSGTQVSLTAAPASGYMFLSWGGDATGTSNPLSITMTANKSITANFNQIPVVNAGADQNLSNSSQATLTGTVQDDGFPTVSWSQLYGPGTVTFSSPNSLTTQAGFPTSGSYALRLTANDGAASASDDLIVAVADSVAPIVSITSPVNGATVTAANVSVTASASDNVGVKSVQIYIDGALKATDTSSPYTYSWNSKKASRGTHTIYAKAVDAAGNSTTSPTISVVRP